MDMYLNAMKIVVTVHIFVSTFLIETVVGQTTKGLDDLFGVRGFCIETKAFAAEVCRKNMNHEQWQACCARGVGECCPCPAHIWNCWYLWFGLTTGVVLIILIVTLRVFLYRKIADSSMCQYVCSWCHRTEHTPSRPENDTMLTGVS